MSSEEGRETKRGILTHVHTDGTLPMIEYPSGRGRSAVATIGIDRSICTKCGACVLACQPKVFSRSDGGFPAVDPARCDGCGHCVAACPAGAVIHGDFPLGECPRIDASALPGRDSFLLALKRRRSIRSFQEKAVPRGMIEILLDAARFGPTGHNLQEVDWIAIESKPLLDKLSGRTAAILGMTARLVGNPLIGLYLGLTEGFDRLAAAREASAALARLEVLRRAGEDPIFYRAPLLLVAHVPSGTYFGRDDAVHEIYNIELCAERIGLGSCLMGYFKIALDRDRSLANELGLPRGRSVEAAVAIGWPRVEYHRSLPRRKPFVRWIQEVGSQE
jgi:nitroreductase/Pyruvate/2-oxoacid:ferredoxin oxidoreductase delta subunit